MSWYGVYMGWYGPMVTRYTGPMVTRYIGGLSQLPEVKMRCGKKSKKKPHVLNIFCFNQFHQKHWPHGHQVTRHTGGLSQLPIVKMSWGKNLRKNLVFLTYLVFWLYQLPVVEMS